MAEENGNWEENGALATAMDFQAPSAPQVGGHSILEIVKDQGGTVKWPNVHLSHHGSLNL